MKSSVTASKSYVGTNQQTVPRLTGLFVEVGRVEAAPGVTRHLLLAGEGQEGLHHAQHRLLVQDAPHYGEAALLLPRNKASILNRNNHAALIFRAESRVLFKL